MISPQEIKDLHFLQNMDEQHLNQIIRRVHLQEFEANSVVFSQGQGNASIYFVLSGVLALQVEEPGGISIKLSMVGPGELLGWSPVLGRPMMTATAQVVQRCRLAMLDGHEMLELCQKDPAFGVEFLKRIALVLSERLWDARHCLTHALSHRQTLPSPPQGAD